MLGYTSSPIYSTQKENLADKMCRFTLSSLKSFSWVILLPFQPKTLGVLLSNTKVTTIFRFKKQKNNRGWKCIAMTLSKKAGSDNNIIKFIPLKKAKNAKVGEKQNT